MWLCHTPLLVIVNRKVVVTLKGKISTDSANNIENICIPEKQDFLTQAAGSEGL